MKQWSFIALAALVLAWSAAAQTAPAANPGGANPAAQQQPQAAPPIVPQSQSPQRGEDAGRQAQGMPVAGQQPASASDEHTLPLNTPILAELTKTVDVKKAKPGDEVTARVQQDVLREGEVVIPHGARLVGHITTAQRAEKGNAQSELGIAWDRVETRKGESFPLHADIQAMAPRPVFAENTPVYGGQVGPTGPPMGAPGGTAGTAGPAGPGGIPTGGETPQVGGVGTQTGPPSTMPPSGQRGGTPSLNPRSTGAQGMPGIALGAPPNPAQGSLIRDSRGNLKLESGTQLVLRVVAP